MFNVREVEVRQPHLSKKCRINALSLHMPGNGKQSIASYIPPSRQVAWSTLQGTDGRVHVYRYTDGADSAGGTFTLAFGGDTSPPISWNASALAMEAALEYLPQVGDVTVLGGSSVTTAETSSTDAAAWSVEFTTLGTPANIGDLPLLEADGSFLTGTIVNVDVQQISAGCCSVEVSANGGTDYSEVYSTTGFRYQDRATVRAVVPGAGPASGGTPVFLLGTGFNLPPTTASGNNDEFVCLFGGRLESPAIRLNSTTATCTSPPTPRQESGAMSVAVRWPGLIGPSVTTAAFTYFEDVTLKALSPRRGSNAGGYETAVSLGRGSFAAVGVGVTCAIEVRLASNLTGGYTSRTYVELAEKHSSSPERNSHSNAEVYVCNVPGLGDFFPGVKVDDWLDDDWGALALVSLSGNEGIDHVAPLTFTYVPRPHIVTAEPRMGVSGGGTSVTVHGTRFAPPRGGFDELELLCRFGHMPPVPARYISDGAVECNSSPHTNVPAIMSAVVDSASVFHGTQEVLLRIPSPMQDQTTNASLAPFHSTSGTWTVSLEGVESDPMYANVTAVEMAAALSALPNVGNATVTAEHVSLSDQHAGLNWNETAFAVHFVARGGSLPMLSVKGSDLRLISSRNAESARSTDDVFAFPVLTPEVSVRVVEEGHDGDGVVREVQVLRTNRSSLFAETQTVTVTTALSPTAEVGLPEMLLYRSVKLLLARRVEYDVDISCPVGWLYVVHRDANNTKLKLGILSSLPAY